MQGYGNEVLLTADAKISAQRSAAATDAADDSVKAFSPTAQPIGASPRQPQPLRPVRTVMPVSVGSGPLPTPHAVPHQSPPAQLTAVAAGVTASGSSSSSSGSSSAGALNRLSQDSSEVSYTHLTPYVGPVTVSDEGSSGPLISGGNPALPQTGRPRPRQSVQGQGQDEA